MLYLALSSSQIYRSFLKSTFVLIRYLQLHACVLFKYNNSTNTCALYSCLSMTQLFWDLAKPEVATHSLAPASNEAAYHAAYDVRTEWAQVPQSIAVPRPYVRVRIPFALGLEVGGRSVSSVASRDREREKTPLFIAVERLVMLRYGRDVVPPYIATLSFLPACCFTILSLVGFDVAKKPQTRRATYPGEDRGRNT